VGSWKNLHRVAGTLLLHVEMNNPMFGNPTNRDLLRSCNIGVVEHFMSDKQVFLTIVGGLLFAEVGGVLLFIPIGLLRHDAGDDGFGLL